MLDASHIHASYGKKEILRGLSLAVETGEIVALVGANGTGKSTLLRVIAGLHRPTEGKVVFEDRMISSLPSHSIQGIGISYLLQGGRVFPSLSVLENLQLAAHFLPRQEFSKRLPLVTSLFPRLERLKGRRAGLLSGGERQMLAIGMTFIQQPKLMLLDEPSAALAPPVVEEIMMRLKDYNQQVGASMLLVEQNVRQAIKICDRVYRLANGTAAEETRAEALFFLPGFMKKSGGVA